MALLGTYFLGVNRVPNDMGIDQHSRLVDLPVRHGIDNVAPITAGGQNLITTSGQQMGVHIHIGGHRRQNPFVDRVAGYIEILTISSAP